MFWQFSFPRSRTPLFHLILHGRLSTDMLVVGIKIIVLLDEVYARRIEHLYWDLFDLRNNLNLLFNINEMESIRIRKKIRSIKESGIVQRINYALLNQRVKLQIKLSIRFYVIELNTRNNRYLASVRYVY